MNAVSSTPCVTCGNPTNGAPRPIAGGGSNTAVIIAVVAIVVLVGIAFIGILSAIAIPNLLTAMERSKQKRTMADMRSISTAVEAYAVDNNKRYPDVMSIDQLGQKLSPTYVLQMPTKDGWGNAFRYECWSSSGSGPCDSYALASAGKDGKFEVEDPSKYPERGATTNFDSDIVIRNGNFIEHPEGPAAN